MQEETSCAVESNLSCPLESPQQKISSVASSIKCMQSKFPSQRCQADEEDEGFLQLLMMMQRRYCLVNESLVLLRLVCKNIIPQVFLR